MQPDMIYLDNSATTPLAAEVADRMNRWRTMSFANASSAHRGGQQARVELEDARERIADAIGAEPKDIQSLEYERAGSAMKLMLLVAVAKKLIAAAHHATRPPPRKKSPLDACLRRAHHQPMPRLSAK